MEENVNKMDLGPFVNEHPKLWDFCWKIYSIENFLKNEKFRYLYLANLISADTIIDEKTAKESIKELTFIKQNIEYFNLDKDTKKKVKEFIAKGIKIAKQDIVDFKQES